MITYEKYAKIRDEKKLTDGKVAEIAGIGRSTFSDWKSGRSIPKFEKMQKISEALGMDYMLFVGPVGKFSSLNPENPLHVEIEVPVDNVPKRIFEYAKRIMKLSTVSQKELESYIEFLESKENKS